MATKNYNMLLDIDLVNAVEMHYGSQGKGISRMINNWFILRRTVIPGMRGFFKRTELTAIVASMNGINYDMKLAVKDVIIHNLKDAEAHDGIVSAVGADLDDLVMKITKLSHADCIFLVDEVFRFWNIKLAYGSPNPRIEEFLNDWGAK